MAELANEEGSKHYKAGKHFDAKRCYQEATRKGLNEPKYPSNLSAVLYELGQYQESIAAIRESWTRLRAQNPIDGKPSTPIASDPMAMKLATRFAKASTNAVACKVSSLHDVHLSGPDADMDVDIDHFAALKREEGGDAKIKDLNAAWSQWRGLRDSCATHTAEECNRLNASAAMRLRAIPILKLSPDPTMEYFRIGHDAVRSLMNGLNGSSDDPYCLDTAKYAHQRRWTFLFGGSGDGRHVFGTMIHLGDMAKKLRRKNETDRLSVHMTLVDIHPATLARVIVIFALLDKILVARTKNDQTSVDELHSTLLYLYISIIMPDYCCQIIMDTCKSLVEDLKGGTGNLLKCLGLYLNPGSISAVVDILQMWSSPLKKSTALMLQRNPTREKLFHRMRSEVPLDPMKKLLAGNKASKADIYTDPDAELDIYDRVAILLPPKTLLSRHTALDKLVKGFRGAKKTQFRAAQVEVEQTWIPNPTMFDRRTGSPNRGFEDGYPQEPSHPYEILPSLANFTKEIKGTHTPSSNGCCGFVASSGFFDLVADAMLELEGAIKVEIIVGDVITGLPKLLNGDLGVRPNDFPQCYSRMFLSNVPDYTHGVLNTAVHLVPYVETNELVMSNCMVNPGAFTSIGDFCYNYTLLNAQDLPRFLGCAILNPSRFIFDDIALQNLPLPRKLDELASKQELHAWLAHLLLCILCNARPVHAPMRIYLPANLGSYLNVLVHLHRVGFPSHWIGDFLQSVISDTLITDVLPYEGTTPVLSSEARKRMSRPRKVHLKAWQADLQVMLAETRQALPFPVFLPSDYPTLPDVKTFKSKIKPFNLERDFRIYMWRELISNFSKIVSLLFFKPTSHVDADFFEENISSIIEGHKELLNVQVQILLSQESVDFNKGEISWKLGQGWYDKMKHEKWVMTVYRTDLNVHVTEPVEASQWLQIS
ncbi:hypothetical protein JR316_0010822 [Psilocybe cubensis]|uniref:Uncharacterized protein n=2 Tax=Psilocybe cubensis TaxID=181762 RepID=A0ACB8GNW7_PSICU|nr:hypothetical protein JR316_0010822 [Psilocybe cubensis]KAH9476906.1 hypothetical protein JR316_0010822 [Psilocybe cubensis]